MMPAMYWMRFAVSPSRSALMIGMPPATAASNATITPFACAASKISLPCTASSALFAVTTCLPFAIARGDARDFDAASGAAFDLFLIAAQHREGAAAHRAEAQEANFDRIHAAYA